MEEKRIKVKYREGGFETEYREEIAERFKAKGLVEFLSDSTGEDAESSKAEQEARKEEIRAALNGMGVAFHPNLGIEKLEALLAEHAKEGEE